MMQRVVTGAFGLTCLLAAGSAMAADTAQCAQRKTVVSSLAATYAEKPVAVGLDNTAPCSRC